jgi:hypothetical protein
MKTFVRLALLGALLLGLVFGVQAQTTPRQLNEGELIQQRRALHPEGEAAQYLKRRRQEAVGIPVPLRLEKGVKVKRKIRRSDLAAERPAPTEG